MKPTESLISIIVPVYNVDQYLNKCIESILNQSYKTFELILINDGSSDNSGEICKNFKTLDTRVTVIEQKNQGVSAARNRGLKEAKGDFICFIDSDDWITENYLNDFFDKKDVVSDLYFQGYTNFNETDNSYSYKHFPVTNIYINYNIQIPYIYSETNKLINSPCFKLFKNEIIKKNKILFDLNLSYGEDHLFVLNYLLYVNSISVSEHYGYIYVHRKGESLTNTRLSHDKIIYYAQNILNARNNIVNKFKITENSFKYFIKYEYALYCIVAVTSLYEFKSNIKPIERKAKLNSTINHINDDKLLRGITFNNYYYFIISKIIRQRVLNRDLLLLIFIRTKKYIKIKLSK